MQGTTSGWLGRGRWRGRCDDEQVGHELIRYAATAQSVELSFCSRPHRVEVRSQLGSGVFGQVNGILYP